MPLRLDRCPSYVAARSTLAAIQRLALQWPGQLAAEARGAAFEAVDATAEATTHHHASVARRHCLLAATASAVRVAISIDIARAMGLADPDLDDAQRVAGRAVAMLGMFLHSTTSPMA